MDYFEFNAAAIWLSALINGDYTSLSGEEEAQIKKFTKDIYEKFGKGHYAVDVDNAPPSFMKDDISELRAMCYEVKYVFAKSVDAELKDEVKKLLEREYPNSIISHIKFYYNENNKKSVYCRLNGVCFYPRCTSSILADKIDRLINSYKKRSDKGEES
jgi:hypothetical protein